MPDGGGSFNQLVVVAQCTAVADLEISKEGFKNYESRYAPETRSIVHYGRYSRMRISASHCISLLVHLREF